MAICVRDGCSSPAEPVAVDAALCGAHYRFAVEALLQDSRTDFYDRLHRQCHPGGATASLCEPCWLLAEACSLAATPEDPPESLTDTRRARSDPLARG